MRVLPDEVELEKYCEKGRTGKRRIIDFQAIMTKAA